MIHFCHHAEYDPPFWRIQFQITMHRINDFDTGIAQRGDDLCRGFERVAARQPGKLPDQDRFEHASLGIRKKLLQAWTTIERIAALAEVKVLRNQVELRIPTITPEAIEQLSLRLQILVIRTDSQVSSGFKRSVLADSIILGFAAQN